MDRDENERHHARWIPSQYSQRSITNSSASNADQICFCMHTVKEFRCFTSSIEVKPNICDAIYASTLFDVYIILCEQYE